MKLSQFPLFQSHLDLAHSYWKKILKVGDIAIDATCGNGFDTLELAHMLFDNSNSDIPNGKLIAMDRQNDAINATRDRLQASFSSKMLEQICLLEQCHSSFPEDLADASVALIVYNLGYLPGGNKAMTTMSSTTLQSIQSALPLLKSGGCLSITCYPGHEEGKREEKIIKEFTATLDPRQWSCCYHSWLNRKLPPSLLIIQKFLR